MQSHWHKKLVFVLQWECSKNSIFRTKAINSEVQLIWQFSTPTSFGIGGPQKPLSWYCYVCLWMWTVAEGWNSTMQSFLLFFYQKHLLSWFPSLLISVASLVLLPLPGLLIFHPCFGPSALSPSSLFPSSSFFLSRQPTVFPAAHSSFPLKEPNLRMNAFQFSTLGKQRNEFLMMILRLSLVGLSHFFKGGRRRVIAI